jgi:hypothetical protein
MSHTDKSSFSSSRTLHQLHRRLARISPNLPRPRQLHLPERMKLRRSLYARPVIIRGEQCAEARLGRQSDRAAGWSCGRQSRTGRWPTAEPSWLPSTAGAVHRNTVGWPTSCGCRPCLRQRVGVLGQRPESSVWCRCPAARVPVHATAVRCPVRASERPDIRCPVSTVNVRCPWVPASTVSGREVVWSLRAFWAGL